MAEDKITKYYQAFINEGYDMLPEEQFRENLKDPAKRRKYYDALVGEGYDMAPFEQFEINIGFGPDTPVREEGKVKPSDLKGTEPGGEATIKSSGGTETGGEVKVKPSSLKGTQTGGTEAGGKKEAEEPWEDRWFGTTGAPENRTRLGESAYALKEEQQRLVRNGNSPVLYDYSTGKLSAEKADWRKGKDRRKEISDAMRESYGEIGTPVESSERGLDTLEGLYNVLKQRGDKDLPGSYEEFAREMSDYGKRRAWYEKKKEEGLWKDGMSYEDFRDTYFTYKGKDLSRLSPKEMERFMGRIKEAGLSDYSQDQEEQNDYEELRQMREAEAAILASMPEEDRMAVGELRKKVETRLEEAEERLRGLMQKREKGMNEEQRPWYAAFGAPSVAGGVDPRDAQNIAHSKSSLDKEIERATAEVAALESSLREFDERTKASDSHWYQKLGQGLVNGLLDPNSWTMGVYNASINKAALESAKEQRGYENKSQTDKGLSTDYEGGQRLTESWALGKKLKERGPEAGGWYEGGHMAGEMLTAPEAYAGGMFGKAISGRAARMMAGRFGLNMSEEAAQRYVQNYFLRRLGTQALTQGGNFMVFEGLGNARQQWEDGGWYDDSGNFHEGFSAGQVLEKMGRGAVLGSAIGGVGGTVHTVGDKGVKALESATAKVLARGGEKVAAIVGEGTVFAMPEIAEFYLMDDDEFDRRYADKYGYSQFGDEESRSEARRAARNSLVWDTWGGSIGTIAGMKGSGLLMNPEGAFKGATDVLKELRSENRRRGETISEVIKRVADRSPLDVILSEDNIRELKDRGYSELGELLSRKETGEETSESREIIKRPDMWEESLEAEISGGDFDGYAEAERLIRDESVSEETRQRVYHALTGRMLPLSTITGWSSQRNEDGSVTVNALSRNGNFVTDRTFKNQKEADREIERLQRESELNIVNIGEQYAEAIRPGMTSRLRKDIKEETGVDIEKALNKKKENRSAKEMEVLNRYADILFGRESDWVKKEYEQRRQLAYEEGKDWTLTEEGFSWDIDPEGRTDEGIGWGEWHEEVEDLGTLLREAESEIEAQFGENGEEILYKLGWFNDPVNLLVEAGYTSGQKEAIANYINIQARLRGALEGISEGAEHKKTKVRAEIDGITHRERGDIEKALTVEGKEVYILVGELAMHNDGSGVDRGASSSEIWVYNPEKGGVELTAPEFLSGLVEILNPDEEYAKAVAEIDGAAEVRQEEILGVMENVEKSTEEGEEGEKAEDETLTSETPLETEGEEGETREEETRPTWQGTVELFEGNREEASVVVDAQIDQSEKSLLALQKKEPQYKAPKLSGSPLQMKEAMRKAQEEYRVAHEAWEAEVNAYQKELDEWKAVKTEAERIKNEELRNKRAEQEERNRVAHEQAKAEFEEEQRIKAEKEAEQEAIGIHAVNPRIKEKWDNANKIEGNADIVTLPDGSTIRGHYVLTEAGAATPSHDVNNAYAPTEGFPIDSNGQSVNDRDYKSDKEAQRIVEEIANAYDSRALQTPVIVSKDGIVLSGNNRTMSGELAAKQGTDRAYIDYLREFGRKYGFIPEIVEGFDNPRLVFVPDEDLPYDSTTFSRFNAQEMKSQSKPEAAVKLGKIVPDHVFGNIVDDISRYDRLSDFYADEKAVAQALGQLMQAGVINDKQMPELRTGTSLSVAGKELIENILIGKVFQSNPDAVRQIISIPTLRQAIVMGLNEIASNRKLSNRGYDLSEELAKAVDLVQRAKTAMPDIYTEGMPISPFGRQAGLFDDEFGDSIVKDATTLLLADILNSGRPSELRKVLATYNVEASQSAAGQIDMFTGGVASKEEILTQVNEHFRNATPKELQQRVEEAIADRKRRATESGRGGEGIEQVENTEERDRERGLQHSQEESPDFKESTRTVRIVNPREMTEEEKKARGNQLQEAEAIEVEEGIIKRSEELTARQAAEKWWDDNVGEPAFYDTEAGEVEINRGSIENSLAHRYGQMKLDAITSLVEGFENAVYLGTLPDNRERGVLDHYFAYPINYKGQRCYVFCRVMQDANKNRLYVHEVFVDDKIKKGDTLQTAASKPHGGISLYKDILANVLESRDKVNTLSEDKQGNGAESSANVEVLSEERPRDIFVEAEKIAEKAKLKRDISRAEAEVNTEPTEAQKEAGNYKKGHVKIGNFDVTIENPKGSVRSGRDRDGKEWRTEMQHTYGYIKGTEGVDGDHIDVYLKGIDNSRSALTRLKNPEERGEVDNSRSALTQLKNGEDGGGPASQTKRDGEPDWNWEKVFVVDQYNPDGTFDEHKVMLGFGSKEEAYEAYLSNYEKGWENGRRIDVTEVSTGDFEKWIESSKRKTKPFAEYSNVKKKGEEQLSSGGQNKPWYGTEAEMPETPDLSPLVRGVLYDVALEAFKLEVQEKSPFDVFGKEAKDFEVSYDSFRGKYRLAVNKGTYDKTEQYLPEIFEYFKGRFENELENLQKEREERISDVKEEEGRIEPQQVIEERKVRATVTPTTYTNKKGKTSDISLVKFSRELTADEKAAAKRLISEPLSSGKKTPKGWYDRNEGGYMMRSEEAAKELVNLIDNPEGEDVSEKLADSQPLSKEDLRGAIERPASQTKPGEERPEKPVSQTKPGEEKPSPINRVNVEGIFQDLKTKGDTKLSDHGRPIKRPGNEKTIEEVVNGPEPKATVVEDVVDIAPTTRDDKHRGSAVSPSKTLKITEDMKRDEDILRDLLGIGEEEVGDTRFKDLDELTPQQKRQIYAAGVNYSIGYIEQGIVSFDEFARAMSNRLGDKIKPWLKSFYEGVKRIPGYEDVEFTPSEEVDRFDVERIALRAHTAKDLLREKATGSAKDLLRERATGPAEDLLRERATGPAEDLLREAETRAAEFKAQRVSRQAEKELIEERNEQRKQEDEQTRTNTEALEAEARAIEKEADTIIATTQGGTDIARDVHTKTREITSGINKIDDTLNKINEQLGVLGYYESGDHISEVEKKVATDSVKLAQQLAFDLGLNFEDMPEGEDVIHTNFNDKRGIITMRIPLRKGYEPLRIEIAFKNDGRGYKVSEVSTRLKRGDDLSYVIGYDNRTWLNNPTYKELLDSIKESADKYLPKEAPKDKQTPATKDTQGEEKPATGAQMPILKQYEEMKKKHPDAILLFRVGDFYEVLKQDAIDASKILGITLTRRSNGKEGAVELAGFPHQALDAYLPKLVRSGRRVAVCEELEDPKLTKKLVKGGNEDKPQDKNRGGAVTPSYPDKGDKEAVSEWLFENSEKIWEPLDGFVADVLSDPAKMPTFNDDINSRQMQKDVLSEYLDEWIAKKATEGNDIEANFAKYDPTIRALDNYGQKGNMVDVLLERIHDRIRPASQTKPKEGRITLMEDGVSESGERAEGIFAEAERIANEAKEKREATRQALEALEKFDKRSRKKEIKPQEPIGSLFNFEEETSTTKDNKEESNGKRTEIQSGRADAGRGEKRQQLRPDESLGASPRDRAKQPESGRVAGGDPTHSGVDKTRGRGVSAGTEPEQLGIENSRSALTQLKNSAGRGEEENSRSALTRLKNSAGRGEEENSRSALTRLKNSADDSPSADNSRSALTQLKNRRNFSLKRGESLSPSGETSRIKANIAAIEKLKELQESGRQATPDEMKILSQYSGWGGLGSAFNERGGYSNYQTAKKLKELLGEDGYQEALKSTRSAFYTPAEVINPLWDLVESLGFKGGNILEGSAGIGNMLALMPREISDRSNIQAVEIDPTTGGILAQLYPDAKVDIQGFEKTKIPNNSVDLAITNVPFVTGLRVTDESGDKDLSRRFGNIHDFAMAKNVRKLKPGGLGIFITSAGTLDGSRDFRKWLVNEGSADVIGAFRLNNKTFGGTNVTSDIIVVRKRINGKPSGAAIDVSETIPVRTAHYSPTRYGETAKDVSMAYNRYFVDHPEHMAGEMQFNFENGETFRATSTGLFPKGDKPQQKLLDSWANDLKERLERANREEIFGSQETSAPKEDTRSREDSEAKEGSLVINSSGKFAIVENGEAVELGINTNKVKGYSKAEVFKDYTAIKKALEELLTYQTENEGETGELKSKIATLNKAYDAFVKKYGHFYKNNQLAWLRNDIDYPSLSALETVKESADNKGNKVISYGKTDIFSRRVVEKEKTPEPENVRDGVITSISLFGKLDVDYISKALGKTVEEVGREIIESGLGFENPEDRNIEVSYQYLSGNVRDKLELARANNEGGRYDRNIRALERVKPMDIPAHLIEFSLGSTWLPSKIYDQYVKEKTGLDVTFSPVGGSWVINKPYWTETEGNKAAGIYSKVLDKWYTGSDIIEAAMKNKTLEFKQSKKNRDGSTETIADPEATAAVGAKVDEYRQDFKDWLRGKLQEDPDFSKDIAEKYNYQFNNYVPLTIPEEFVPQRFPGSVTSMGGVPFSLRPHQSRAVIKASTEPVLFAHEVGTGKTYTLITSAMEMRRLGLAQKPMIVVQNATLGQFVDSAKQLYPNAKILTLTDKDRTKEGRLGFYAKIKYNDWDMIVVPQSVFDMIPDSPQREAQYISDKIEEKRMVLDRLIETSDGRDPMVRRAQKELEDLENQLVAITESANKGGESVAKQKQRITALENAEARAKEMLDRRTDSVENFDDMGIDAILVDEAHEYKHLGFTTAMQRGVKGVDPSYSKKAQGLYLKTQAVRDRKGNRNIVFATGTPISNTAAEVWTFMRYLMPEEMMKDYDIYYFDDFVRNFGSLQQMLEFTTSGKFKENNRFAGYTNLPELARLWSSVADIVLTSEAGAVRDKIPAMEGEKAQDIYLPQTQELRSIMKYVKAELQKFEEMTGAEKRQNSHIPLTMYGIANAAAIDPRLVKDGAMDEPNSKTNEAVRQTLQALKDSEKYKGTVAIFSDKYQNQRTGFNLYEDIKKKLVAEGVREDEIAIMKPGMKIEAKQKLFDKVNNGEVRVILGSTQTLGTGVNIQERLFGLIHLDAPNRPMDYWQRMGRILRQGNLFKEWGIPVRVLRFGVEDSLDVTAYQRLKTKGAIADSIMHSKDLLSNAMENRVMEEEEDVFGDTIAQLSGSEYAMLKSQAEKQVRKLEGQKKSWQADQMYVTRQIPRIKEAIEKSEKDLETTQRGLEEVKKHFPDGEGAEIKVGHSTYTDPGEMGEFFKDYNSKIKEAQNQVRGTAEGNKETRNLTVKIGGVDFNFTTTVESSTRRGNDGGLFAAATTRMTYSSPTLGIKERHVEQALLRNGVEDILNNVITGSQFEKEAEAHRDNISLLEKELKALEPRQGEPFKYEKELMEATARLEDYTEKMKAELEAKEAKYAEMDKGIESAEGIHLDEEGEGGELRYRTSEEIDREYPNWLEGTTTDTGKHSTQVEGTRKTYGKIGNWIEKNLGKDVSILDASSGMGYGTRDLRDRGFNIEDVEPYQSEQRRANNPATYDSYSDVKKKYDYIISNAVLNVIPDDWRRDVLHNMAERLSPGGRLFINTRKAGEEKAVKDKIELDTPQEILVKRNGKIASYQRFFTPSELKNWVEEELGEGYSVEIANEKNSGTKGLAAVVVKRLDGDNFKRDGEGPQSDYEINMATDLIARVQGYSNKTPRQQRAWADRERQHMNEIAKTLGKNLGLNIDIRQDNTGLKGRRARAKGWYDISDGKITVIIGNHTSAADVEKTILHEAVAHYGLRQLLGKHFDEFLDVVYEHSEDSIREEIDRLTDRMVEREAERLTQQEIDELDEIPTGFIRDAYKEKNRAKAEKKREEYRKEATEEFMADVAENTDFENAETQLHGWFSKIKKWFIDILFKLGFKHITGRNLGLNELRYVLWRSYQNLKNPGRYRGFEWEAEDIAMRAKTGVLKEQYPDEGSRNINKVAEAAEKEMIEAENARYNQSLERYSRGELKASEVIEVGRPIGVVRNFMPDEVMILRKGVIKKALNKHGLKIGDLQNLPEGIAKPLFIFQRDKSSVSLLTAVKGENGKNLFVSIELGVKKPISKELTEINDITTIHGRDVENVILPILENETLKYKDPLRGLQWIEDEKEAYRKRTQEEHSAELNPQSITLETFDDAAKVIENFENPKFGGGEIEEGGHEEEGLLFRDGESLTETIERMTTEAEQANVDNLATKRDAMLALGGNLNKLRSVMARQREYDTSTVRSITGLVNTLMERGLLDDISKYETKRILSVAGNVVGRQDISKYVDKVMDILVENQLRGSAKAFGQLLSIKGSKVDARGIEVQGILDPDGQRIAQVVKKTSTLPKADIEEKILEALNRMGSSDIAISEEAALEYAGLQISRQYAEDITESKAEERSLRESIKQAKEDKEAGQMTEASYRQYVEATEDAIRQNKAERAEAYQSLIEQMSGVLGESIDRAKAWKNAEVARVKAIQHNANSDMEGRPTDEHHKNSRLQKLSNNSGVRFLLAPLATFDQMLRMFGKKNVGGEGYLWNRYMRGWVDATEKEYTGYRDALKVLDDKAREIFAPGAHTTKDSSQRGRHRIKSFGDLFVLDRQLPKGSVRFWDGGEMKEHELTQGNMLYIYMTDKMADGRMKLRRMGITEEDIEDIKDFLDPRFIELADWIQEEFLTEKRNEYNEVHKRMFGASMAAIENYFPLKILANARTEDVDVADDTTDTALPSTSTGSIIKRRRNNLALDVTGANAFSVILDHLQQMERWAAFAEYNRDLNTLLSYKRFRNQVMNMNSAYGAGKTLWNNFRNVAAMSAGSYRPPIAALDKSAVNIAKGVTAAKVSFRMFTALKQFLSMPAYMSEVNPLYLGKSLLNPIKAWRWSMENLPLFEKRWKSRMAGDPRLMKTEMDWKAWRNNIVQIASRIGMSPNAFVDALTVAIGTYPKYETNYKKYLRQGYSKEEADKRAKEDASILFNQTQQSSEGAFLSTMQVDRSWLSVLFTVFRNSSMSYTRQLYDAIRNLKGRGIELFNPGERQKTIDFMAKQLLRTQKPEEEGVWSAEDWSRAKKSAEAGYKSSILRDLARVGIFGFALQLAWNLGAYLPYLILGEDEEEKGKMWRDAMSHAMFGSVEGLTGGDVMSGAGQMFMTGEGNLEYLSKEMPLAGDVMNILKKMPKDQLSAMNDIINLIVQSGVGVNPQSLTDAVVAVMDATNGDMETGREAALMIARIMNCPQSQLDKIYFDEIDAIGTEASRMTPGEIAERYARYKIRREAPLTGWMRDESTGDSIKSQREKRVFKAVEEKLDGRMATEETKKLMEEYESYAKDKRALSAIDKDENPDEYWEAWEAFQEKWGPEADWRYKRLQEYKRDIKAMTDSLLSKSISVEEMQGIVERMIRARDVMLEETSE